MRDNDLKIKNIKLNFKDVKIGIKAWYYDFYWDYWIIITSIFLKQEMTIINLARFGIEPEHAERVNTVLI